MASDQERFMQLAEQAKAAPLPPIPLSRMREIAAEVDVDQVADPDVQAAWRIIKALPDA